MMAVHWLGGADERSGFMLFTLIVAVLFIVFITITCVNVREKSTVDMKAATVGEMFSALVKNDQAMAAVIAIVLINCSIYITSNLVIYFFKYDFGGTAWYQSYTYFNIFGGGIQIVAMMLFYPLLRKVTENIRIFYVALGSAIAGYASLLAITFTPMKQVFVLFIPAFFIFSANGILSVLATVFLANSVDYGELVNNRRDESVIFSMQTFVVKLASGIAAFAASVCLSVNNLKSEEITEAEKSIDFSLQTDSASRLGLRMTMTVIPVIGLFIALFYFKKKFILDEKKMEEITAELGRKHAEDK
jgi:melibiose permease